MPAPHIPARGLTSCLTIRQAIPNNDVTLDRLERGLAVAAYLLELEGPVVAPIFEKLEKDIEAMRASENTMGRARRLLESYKTAGRMKAIP